MIKVRMTDIPYEGLPVEADLSLKALNARLDDGEGGSSGFVFQEVPSANVRVFRTSHGGEVKGKLRGKYMQTCSFCPDEVARELDLEVNVVVRQRPEGVSEDSPEWADDVGIYYYQGEHVDLEEIFQELILLSLDMYWHPPLDEIGKCTLCGREFRESDEEEGSAPALHSLGDLFKKAGIKS